MEGSKLHAWGYLQNQERQVSSATDQLGGSLDSDWLRQLPCFCLCYGDSVLTKPNLRKMEKMTLHLQDSRF